MVETVIGTMLVLTIACGIAVRLAVRKWKKKGWWPNVKT